MTPRTFTTDTLTVSAQRHIRAVMWRVAAAWWWVIALPLTAVIAASLHDTVWLYVALMLLFILYPTLLFFVYVQYGFSPEAVSVALPHTVTVGDDGIRLRFTEHPALDRCYTYDNIAGVERTADECRFLLRRPRYQHVTLPLSAIRPEDRMQLDDIIARLSPDLA